MLALTIHFFLDNRNLLCYMSPIPSPEGACLDRLGHVGRERRPRRSGLARLSRLAGNGPDRPGGLLRHPSGTTTGAPNGG
jgi:hypothetical protein